MKGFSVSYTPKNKAAPGALPTAAAPNPRDKPPKPPAAKKPCGAWRRVFIVSIGYSKTSHVVPAKPPQSNACSSEIEEDASLLLHSIIPGDTESSGEKLFMSGKASLI
jgi:hypothetical protein